MTIKQKIVSIIRPQFYTRPTIKAVREINNSNKELVGVEIGVAEGINAYNILRVLPVKKLYLVDPYSGDWNKIHDMARNLLKPFKRKIEFVRETSSDAVGFIPGNLDFVYIDGDHSYDGVSSDFNNYYSKVKKGSVIGGHDFNIRTLGVVRFVLELEHRFGCGAKVNDNDWWIVKKN